MFTVIECVLYQHDNATVLLAAGILVVGMVAFFHLLVRADESTPRRKPHWIVIAAVASGLSIWATHFVSMLGYQGGMPISFDVAFTAISAIAAVIGILFALRMSAGGVHRPVSAGLCLTAAVAAMHFIGMAGLRAAADITYNVVPIAIGLTLTVALFILAFHLFRKTSGLARIGAPALTAILGVCVLHFTAVSSTILVPNPTIPGPEAFDRNRIWLTAAVSGVTLVVALGTAIAAIIDRYLVDLKGFANASLDGLAVIRDRRIIEVNGRFAELAGSPEAALIGKNPDDYLIASDGLSIDVTRPLTVEAAPCKLESARVYELAVQTIEYRGRPSQVVAVRDLTEKLAAQRKVEYLARHDMLTGLANRTKFQERLAAQLGDDAEHFAVIALDLDRFKAVNDLFGHAEGDRVLRDVAAILSESASSSDLVARIGGDEFMIVTMPGAGPDYAHTLARGILAAFQEKMNLNTDPTAVGVSIGIALYPHDAADMPGLIHAADLALYRAKVGGRGLLAFYDLEMDQETRQRRELEADLRQAIGRGELYLLYQPIQSVEQGIIGYEALLRWRHAVHGEVAPDLFIPIAEDTGAIFSIGEWVLREACREATRWPSSLKVAVNISPVQFRVSNLTFSICRILDETGLAPGRLELEITESALLRDRDATLETLRQLKAIGLSIVMDDFGTGYSSLSNLQSFPFDKLKIDRSFTAAMNDDDNARAIVKAVVGLGRSLNLPVTAEGIETDEQYAMVVAEGCAQVQGYLFGKPGKGPLRAKEARPAMGVALE